MVIINQQWQGSGMTDEIKAGTNVIKNYFKVFKPYEVELSEEDLSIKNGIIAYNSIIKQLENFRNLINSNNPKHITTIGGDCGIAIIPISYLNLQYNNLAVIWLDAHADLNTPDSSPSKTFHGMPMRLLLGEGDEKIKKLMFSEINANQILYVGLRNTDKAEEDYIIANDIFRTSKINYAQIKKRLTQQNFNKIYIHIDLDVIDPSIFQFVKVPSKNGVEADKLASLITQLQNDYKVVGYSICESIACNNEQISPIKSILNAIKKGTTQNKK